MQRKLRHLSSSEGDGSKVTGTVRTERARDDLFFALSNYRRRFVVTYLSESGESVSLRTLTEALAAWENDVDPEQTAGKERKRAYVALRQSHLPQLDDLGIIQYDNVRGFVEPGKDLENVAAFLEEPSTAGVIATGLYRYLAVSGVALFTLVALGIATI